MNIYKKSGWTSEVITKICESAGKSIQFSDSEISMLVCSGLHDPAIEYNGFMY